MLFESVCELKGNKMFNLVAILVGVICGITIFFCVLKSKSVIGRQYFRIDWIMVSALAAFLFVFAMSVEWVAYTVAIWIFGKSAETNVVVFLLKKGCLVPIFSWRVSRHCGWYIHKQNLDYSEGYSTKTAICVLSVIVLSLCINAQWMLTTAIDDVRVSDFIEDSIVAWGLMVAGSIFALGSGCAGRRDSNNVKRGAFHGFVWPVLSAVIVGLLGGIASLVHLSEYIPSFVMGFIPASLICVMTEYLRQSLWWNVNKIRRAYRKNGFTKRKTKGVYRGIRFEIEGEWLTLERDELVQYCGTNKDFDTFYGYQRKRVGTTVDDVRSKLVSRHNGQVGFSKSERKLALDFPDKYPLEKARYAKGK